MNSEIASHIVKEKFIVSKIYGAFYEIYSKDLGIKRAILKGKLRLENHKERHPFVVGDKVIAENYSSNSDWIIISKEERMNSLIRQSSNTDAHVLCANVDYVIILASLADPETKDGFIDRSITAIFHSGAKPIILFNKKDLISNEDRILRENKYKRLGYDVFSISCYDLNSADELKNFIKNKTCYLVGNSGVGKSSFINLFSEKYLQRVDVISHSTHKGKHTTTNSNAIFFEENTILIDSPGIKEWGLLHLSKGEILETFPEFSELKKECTISECCTGEMNCSILENLDSLDEERKKSLESMLLGLEVPYRIRVGNLKSGKLRKKKKEYNQD
jgi:ribosome biogenesis GTPase